MSKAVISNRIYLNCPPEGFDNIKQNLTYKIKIPGAGKGGKHTYFEIIRNYKLLPNNIISIPQGRVDLIPEGYEIIDKRVTIDMPFPEPKIVARPEQQEVIDKVDSSCFINALVGWGKSYAALHAIKNLGQKTLIVAHNTVLRDQWVDNIEKMFGILPGIIGSGEFDIDSSIVVGNIQTLTKHGLALSKEFGTVVLDECLDYDSTVTTETGEEKIGVIVNQQKPVKILSADPITGNVSYKDVLRYFKNKATESGLQIHHEGGGSIKCTNNHSIYVYTEDGNVWKNRAEDLEIGDYLIQSVTKHKSTHMLNKEWESIFLGLLLGDGNLGYPHNKSTSVRLKITHGQAQKEYLDWKAKYLLQNNFTITKGKSGYKPENSIFSIVSKSFVDLNDWYNKIYVDGSKKRIPQSIAKKLTKESWAIIFQDDGSSAKDNDCVTFSVCEFDATSCNNLVTSLVNVFNLSNPVIFTCTKGFNYIRLNKDDTLLFLNSIKELIHPNLYYKISRFNLSNLEFNFPIPNTPNFNEDFSVRKITKINTCTLTNGYRYNIEVEDNHTYFANGILVGNCHHVPATTFTQLIDSMYAKYRIGLSGTMLRKDGKHVLLRDYFGDVVFKPAQSNTLNPVVKLVNSGIALTSNAVWAKKINNLLYDVDYQEYISIIARTQISRGHSVLIIADRVEFLNNVKELLGENCVLVTGETGIEERKTIASKVNSGEITCIAGSRQIFSEGISINRLSCVILATPISSEILLEQIVGRIMRMHEGKPNPVVVDIQFAGYADKKQNNVRLGFYLNKGWEVQSI